MNLLSYIGITPHLLHSLPVFLPHSQWQIFGMLLVLVLEYWLGKTEKVKGASILEVCILTVSAAVCAVIGLFNKEKKDGNK